MRLLVTRSIEDAEPLAAALRRRGIEAVLEPLMSITDVAGAAGAPDLDTYLDPGGAQALLITSANGIRAFARRTSRRDIAVFAVGDASARTAFELGFAEVRSAAGDVDALAALVSDEGTRARARFFISPAAMLPATFRGCLRPPVLTFAGRFFTRPRRRKN